MKNILICFLLISTIICAQSKKRPKSFFNVIDVTEEYKVAFSKFNSEFKLYQKPVIIKNNKWHLIENYDDENFSGGNIVSISPNKKFIVLDYIIKGYVGDRKDNIIHENYLCIIVELSKYKVVMQMQSDCGGGWNNKNNWVNNEKIIFDGN